MKQGFYGRRQSDLVPVERKVLLWTFGLSSIVIVASVVATLYYIFFSKWPHPSTYQVVIVLLFFALSTLSSLLFASQTRLQGNIAGFTLTLAGPATLWIIGLIIFFTLFPYKDLFQDPLETPIHLERVGKLLHEVESQQNWKDYWTWKNDVSTYRQLLIEDEPNTLEKFLAAVYHKDSREKTVSPRITTAFLYINSNVVKLQRIQGDKEETSPHIFIRFQSRPSQAGAEAKSVLLVGNGDNDRERFEIEYNYTELTAPIESGYSQLFQRRVDCLIITWYDDPRPEDFFMVNMKRFSRKTPGTTDIGVFSYNWKIRYSSFWLMKSSKFLGSGEVPLYFLNLGSREPNTDRIRDGLADWLKVVDSTLNRQAQGKADILKPAVYQKLHELRQLFGNVIGKPVGYSNILEHAHQQHAYHTEKTPYTAMVLAQFSK